MTAFALPPASIARTTRRHNRPRPTIRDEYLDRYTNEARLLFHFSVATDTPLGMLNWSFVHGTRMNNTKKRITPALATVTPHRLLPVGQPLCDASTTFAFHLSAAALRSCFAGGTMDRPEYST